MKRKLLLAMAAVLSIVGVQKANAYTTSDLTSAGWTQVTSITDVDNNYYVFVDAETSEYAMARTTNSRPVYQKLTSPLSQSNLVWILEDASDGKYYIKSYFDNYYFYSGNAGWNNSMDASSKSALTFTLSEGKYMISDETFTDWKYLGPWNGHNYLNTDKGWSQDQKEVEYQRIVDNKKSSSDTTGDISEGFFIFSMSKTTYAANCRNEATLVSEGWSKVTETTGLGKAGYYYAFLDSELPGLVMAHTSAVRPVYQPLGNPTSDATLCWTTESYGDGYAIKSVSDNTYIYNTATWNCQFGTIQSGAEYLFTLNDGKWKLRNTIAGESEYLGQWYNFNDYPFADEGIAANKTSSGVKEWFIYSIPTIAGVATELPANGDMAADTWYYIDINAAADNYTATATTLGDIFYTTDGTALVRDVTSGSTFTAADNSLSATRYYVKSSSANNLVIGVSSYTYTVGTPTPSIADGSYQQTITTLTLNYADAAGSNDPGASFAILDNTAKAALKLAGSTVAEGTLSLDGKVLTATFPETTLTLGSTYTLELAADVVGYAGQADNTAISLTVNTPAVADGVYYMYNTYTQNYLSRSGSRATQAIMDNRGLAVFLESDTEGKTTVKYFDNLLYLGNNGFCYGDAGTGHQFTVTAVEGGYKFLCVSNNKYLAVYDGQSVNDAVEGDNLQGTSNVWALETPAQHVANYTTNANAQVATATANITVLSSITTKSALETELATNYGETNVTITGSKGAKYQVYAAQAQTLSEAEYYKETVENLKPGLYKLSVDAFQRASWYDWVYAAGGARGNIYLYANDAKTQIKSVMEYGADATYSSNKAYDGKNYPYDDTSAYTALETGNYTNDVYVYVAADEGEETGTLVIGINNPTRQGNNVNNGTWAVYNNWTLTYYEAKATASEKEALATAITAAEAKTLGFEKDEYAPYNNVAAIEALVAAKAIDADAASGAAVVAATTALTGATWTPNDKEVNAIYWDYSTLATTDKSKAYGWYDPALSGNAEGSMYSTRVFNHVGSNAGLAALDNNVALFTKTSTNYGKVEGYTLPLKANRTYKLSFKFAGWTEPSESTITITDENGENTLAISGVITVSGDAQNGNSSTEAWADYEGYFTVSADGNYILNINRINMGNNVQRQLVMGNISLVSTDALVFADGSVPTYAPGTYPSVKISRTLSDGNWATAVYPFAVSGVDNIAVLDSYDKSTGALGFKSAAASTANEPFLMRSTAGATEISLSNVAVVAAAATDVVKSEASLKGVYTSTDIDNTAKNYVLKNNIIYSVGTAGATINPYRAYIQIAQEGEAKALRFVIDGEDATGIESIAAEAENTVNGQVYDMSGRLVKNPVRGMYIVNGKKVLVK